MFFSEHFQFGAICILLIAFVFEMIRYKLRSGKFFLCYTFFITFMYILVYVAVPLFFSFMPDIYFSMVNQFWPAVSKLQYDEVYLIYVFLGFLSAYSFITVVSDLRYTPNYSQNIVIQSQSILIALSCFSIFFIAVSFYIYGPELLINNIRFHVLDKSHIGSFFIHMSFVSVIGCLLLLIKARERVSLNLILFAILLVPICIFSTIQGAGRGAILSLMIYVFLVYYFSSYRINPILLVSAIIIIVLFGVYGRTWLWMIYAEHNIGNFVEIEFSIVPRFFFEFAFPSISFLVALDTVELSDWSLRLGSDFFIGLIFYLKLFGIDTPDSITYYNTLYLVGEYKSSVPPGIMAFSVYSFGTWGWVLIGPLLAAGVYALQVLSERLGREGFIIFMPIFILLSINFIMNADPRVIYLRFIPILLAWLVFYLNVRKKDEGSSH